MVSRKRHLAGIKASRTAKERHGHDKVTPAGAASKARKLRRHRRRRYR